MVALNFWIAAIFVSFLLAVGLTSFALWIEDHWQKLDERAGILSLRPCDDE